MATVWGTNNSETLDQADGATNGADVIIGLDGKDKLWGLGGSDYLKGGGGADELHGGAGQDWADYSDATSGVDVYLSKGKGSKGYAEGDTYDSIENVWGSGYHDTIHGDDNPNHLYGGGGVDWLRGGFGADILDGGDNLDAADYFDSPSAVFVDLMNGTASGGHAYQDTLISISGVRGSAFADLLIGDDENNNLMGGGDDDWLFGNGGDDWLEDGAGNDDMWGGLGNDHYYVGEAGDLVIESAGEGTDGVYARIDYKLPANVEHLVITNNATKATGNELDNNILGNDLGNTITGGLGHDWLQGNGGADFFVWTKTEETAVSQATADIIDDFDAAEGDRIDVAGVDADVYAAGNQAFTFIGTAAFSGTPGEINYVQANGKTYIQLQTGTTVDVEAVICIEGIVTPEASWFVL